MRYVLVGAGVLALLGAIVGVKACQISSLIAYGRQTEAAGPPPEVVGTARTEKQSWEVLLSAVGTVAGKKSVAVSNDAPGVVTAIRFESGAAVRPRQVLVELDASVERGQLASAQSRRVLARVTVRRTRNLVAVGAVARAQLDNDQATLAAAEAEVDSLQAEIERKIVRAPFAGRLGVRTVDLGQYLEPGTPVTILDSEGALFIDFTLPQERLAEVAVGMPVRVTAAEKALTLPGKVTAVSPTVDPAMRTIQLRAAVDNQRDELRPGMFVDVAAVLARRIEVVAVPATAIIHASYGDSVFIVEAGRPGEPRTARQQIVRVTGTRGDFVAVEGISAGQEVVTAGAFKLRNGSRVVVDNRIQAKPRLDPMPENR